MLESDTVTDTVTYRVLAHETCWNQTQLHNYKVHAHETCWNQTQNVHAHETCWN